MTTHAKALTVIFILLISGCASKQGALPLHLSSLPADDLSVSENTSWRACRFKITWPHDTEPDFTTDILIAHAIIQPVLQGHVKKIPWWRFHRRAARDITGHQFSFMYYSDAKVSQKVIHDIEQSLLLKQLLIANFIETLSCDDPNQVKHPKIEAMSDPRWSPTLQKNWPTYIMGVSALWLGLIDDAIGEALRETEDPRLLHKKYQAASSQVTALWYQEGQHAFFHHLSAIFGYAPLLIRKNITF